MPVRSYDQYCGAARGLEIVGERWTLLVVRDLLFGPKRYTDLQAGLPGIGPNVLAARLRLLQEAGVVRRRVLPPPAASTVYELTPLGEDLRPVIRELTRWGRQLLGTVREGEELRLGWLLVAMEATFRPELARGVRESYEFRVDGEVFHVDIDDGTVDVAMGEAADPAFVVVCDLETFMATAGKQLSLVDAVASGRAQFSGDADAARRAVDILGPHLLHPEGEGGIVGAIRASLEPLAEAGRDVAMEAHIDGHTLFARVAGGEVDVGLGAAPDANVRVTTDLPTFLALGTGQLAAQDAIASGRARVEGDVAAWAEILAGAFAGG